MLFNRVLKTTFIFLLVTYHISCTMSEAASKVNPKPIKEIPPPVSAEMQAVVSDYSDYVKRKIFNGQSPVGMSIGIVKDGNILLEEGFGYRNHKTKEPVNSNTVFRIASLSKGFAGGLAATLVRDNQISWSTKVKDILPDLEFYDEEHLNLLELQHLLSQTSGMPRHTFGNLIESKMPLEDMIGRLHKVKPIADPGKVLSYQNVVYSLIDPILEKVTGKSYEDLMQQRIYEPLNMDDASTDFASIDNHPNFALPHRRNKSLMRLDSAYYSVMPAAGVNASISDMNQWLLAMLGHHPSVLSEDLLFQITSKRVILPSNNPWSRSWKGIRSVGYGFGWRIVDYKGLELVYHGGLVNGYRAEIAFCPDENVGIVLLSNSRSSMIHKSIPHFFDFYLSRQILNKGNLDRKEKENL